jgi:hypothetical protein
MRSVFARRPRREVRIDAASTTWLSIPSDSITRWIQNPSRPDDDPRDGLSYSRFGCCACLPLGCPLVAVVAFAEVDLATAALATVAWSLDLII